MKFKKLIIGLLVFFCIFIISFLIGKGISFSFKNDFGPKISNTIKEENVKNTDFKSLDNTSSWHQSDIEIPEEDKCNKANQKFFEGLNNSEKESISYNINVCHVELENLLSNYALELKDSNSPYWTNSTEAGSHEEPGHPDIVVVHDGGFSLILENLTEVTAKIKNAETKQDLAQACKLLHDGIENHDINKILGAHEYLHDYDNWVVSNPYRDSIPLEPDREGTWVYFGRVLIM